MNTRNQKSHLFDDKLIEFLNNYTISFQVEDNNKISAETIIDSSDYELASKFSTLYFYHRDILLKSFSDCKSLLYIFLMMNYPADSFIYLMTNIISYKRINGGLYSFIENLNAERTMLFFSIRNNVL